MKPEMTDAANTLSMVFIPEYEALQRGSQSDRVSRTIIVLTVKQQFFLFYEKILPTRITYEASINSNSGEGVATPASVKTKQKITYTEKNSKHFRKMNIIPSS